MFTEGFSVGGGPDPDRLDPVLSTVTPCGVVKGRGGESGVLWSTCPTP